MENKDYRRPLQVDYYEGDYLDRLKMAGVLRYAQQVSGEHCDILGINQELYRLNKVFLLVKVSIELSRMPMAGELLEVVTTPSLPVRAQYKRLTEFYDRSGERIIAMDSRWVLADVQTHRIERRMPPEFNLPLTQFDEIPTQDLTIPKPERWVTTRQVEVLFSLLDRNGHVNNTQYANLICDSLPFEELSRHSIEKFVISYHREAVFGDRIDICCQELPEGQGFYVGGKVEDKLCFEALVRFAAEG